MEGSCKMRTAKNVRKRRWLDRYSTMDRKKFPFVYLLIALPVLQICVFYFYVNVSAFAYAFQDEFGNWGFGSIKRVYDAFATKSDRLGLNPWEMIYKSVISWSVTNILGFTISILTSFVLTKHMIFSKGFRLIYYIPGIVGGVVLTSIMKEMYAYNGLIVRMLKSWGADLPPMVLRNGMLGDESTAYLTIQLQRLIFGIAGGNMIVAGAYMRIPEEIFESAKLEGCGFFREVFQIAVPCVWPTLSTMMIFSLCSILTADYDAYLYSNGTGANGMVSVGFYLYRYQVSLTQSHDNTHIYGYISAFGVLITCVTLPIVIISRKILAKVQEAVEY